MTRFIAFLIVFGAILAVLAIFDESLFLGGPLLEIYRSIGLP